MREAFKINIPLGFPQVFSSYRPDCCTPPLNTGTEENDKRGDSLTRLKCPRLPPTTWRPVQAQHRFVLYLGENAAWGWAGNKLHKPKPQMAHLPSPYNPPGVEIWETPFGRAHNVTSEAQAVLSMGKRQAGSLGANPQKEPVCMRALITGRL